MKTYLLFLFLFLTNIILCQKDYFQQEVNYKIDVQLDDKLHILMGTIDMEYTNNAPEALHEIYIHLWPNAYANKETAFAEQQLNTKNTKFYFSDEQDLGGLSNLAFLINGQKANWALDEEHIDIAKIQLDAPLKTGESLTISTPFELKIPASFSRLGHVETSYQMTQWYPKPAVYDKNGWHPMPYLNMGEFYSEFGDFDVSITLPENYVVGATGVLQTKSEQQFLDNQIKKTKAYLAGENDLFPEENAFPTSSKKNKTIRYKAENVHDFAWFADKRFRVLKGDTTLNSGRKIDTWIMFTEKEEEIWKYAIKYVNRSVKFYSDHVGEYPYPHATAIQSALSAGGGMEYPMITVIGLSSNAKSLDEVITHEVGHNWFYGILASNERIYPWMDEGLNSYYEFRYMKEFYKLNTSMESLIPAFIKGVSGMSLSEASYLYQARRNLDQAPNTPSAELTSINYGLSAYMKPALSLDYLANYLGQEAFDKAMKSYYEQWKFKHPYPKDFQASLEASTGEKLDWLFDGLLLSNKKMDYALQNVKVAGDQLEISVKNKGDITAPFPISAVKNGEVIATKWYEGIDNQATVTFNAVDYDDMVIDVERITLDVDRTDNRKKANSLKINWLAQIEDDKKRTLSLFPMLSWNAYDKLMFGIGIHNKSLPARNFEFALTPMYAVNSDRIAGVGTLRYNIYPRSNALERISLQLNGRTFSHNFNEDFNFHNYFTKIAPKLEFKLGKKQATSNVTQLISLRHINIQQNIGRFNADAEGIVRTTQNYGINELQYQLINKNVLTPSSLKATVEQSSAFSKLSANYRHKFPYQDKKKYLELRFFGGYFFQFDATKAAELGVRPTLLLTGNTTSTFQQDYLFDEVLFGRSDRAGIWSRQIFDKDASFRTTTSQGASDNLLISSGLRSTLPRPLPFQVFGDIAYSSPKKGDGAFFYSTGLIVPIFKNVFEIYIPIFESDAINANHTANGREGIFERVTFKLDLTKLNLFEVIDNFEVN